MASCFGPDSSWHAGANCSLFQKAGQLWVARLHQYLLANGIVILGTRMPETRGSMTWDDPSLATAQAWTSLSSRRCLAAF